MARILAKALNCQSSDKPTTASVRQMRIVSVDRAGEGMDVIEIDAASNTQVDKSAKW